MEVPIRTFSVGLIALAAVAAAGLFLRRRRPALASVGGPELKKVSDLYEAGL